MSPLEFVTIDGKFFSLLEKRPDLPPPLLPLSLGQKEPYYGTEWLMADKKLWLVGIHPFPQIQGMDDLAHWQRFFLNQPSPVMATWVSDTISVYGGGSTAERHFEEGFVPDYGYELTFLIRKGVAAHRLIRKVDKGFEFFGQGTLRTRLNQWIRLRLG